MQVVDVNGNMFGYDHLEIIGADGRPKTLDSGLTSVGLSMPSAFSVSNSPLTSNGTIGVTGAGTSSEYIDGTGSLRTFPSLTGYVTAVTASAPLSSSGGTTPNLTILRATSTTDGYLTAIDWNTFNSKQPAGNYITALSGEASGSGPGTASVTLNNASVTAKVLTGVNITGGSINSSDSILTAFGKLQNQINGLVGSSIYQGVWNASTNTPALASGVGTRGYYYIVNVAGSTNLDGITDWNVGDWAIFDGTAWQQVDNTDSVTSVNGQTGAVSLTTDNIPEGVTNLYFTNLRARQSLSLTTSGSSGASTYNNTTGVLNVPNYTLSGLGGVPTSRRLEINGVSYDLSADRSWSVGTVTSVDMTVPTGLTVTGSPITGAGTLALGLQSGYSIPTTANQSNWTTAYNRSIISAAVNYGVASTSLVLTQQNTGTVTASLIAGAASQGKFVFFNGTNLAYTSLNASAPLSFDLNTYTFSISQAGASTNGFLSSTDWNTFNNKQNAITLTTTGSSGAATLIGSTLNIPNYSSALSGYVPTSRQLTINGTSYDLSADRSWSVGTVTSVATTGPITGGTITGSGTIGITQATTSTDGYLSSTDWNTFNDKQEEITLTTIGTSGPATLTSDSLNIPDYSSAPRGNFAQTTKSVPITNTTEAQSLIYVNFERRVDNDGGVTESLDCMEPELRNYGSVGSLSVPANSFKVGDSFHVNLSGYISSQNNQDIAIRVMANGGATVLALASTTLVAATNKFFDLVITFTIRAIGSAGVAKIATSGQFTYSKDASNAFEGTDFIFINDDTFDTTIDNTLDITAQWANASTSNSIYSEIFTLQKIY